jgi:hypothetical protein
MDRIKDVLHLLMKKQRKDRFARLIQIENLQNEYGSDEALGQAEVDRQQALGLSRSEPI